MAKKTWLNIAGIWKESKNVWTNVDGVWKEKNMPSGKILGAWKEFMQYITVIYNSGSGANFNEVYRYLPNGTASFYSKPLYLEMNTTLSARLGISSMLSYDVTNFKRIFVEWEIITAYNTPPIKYVNFGLNSTNANPQISVYKQVFATAGRQIDVLDVSNVTGQQFVKFLINGDNNSSPHYFTVRIYKIWFE